jgi:hypothetical protein
MHHREVTMMTLKESEIVNRAINSNAGNCILLLNCGGLLRSGDFVRYASSDRNGSHGQQKGLLVGQVVAIEDLEKIPHAERRACAEVRGNEDDRMALIRLYKIAKGSSVRRPNSVDYPNIPSSLEKVIRTNNVEWIKVENILTIAFVFHLEEINKGRSNCGGMRNAFFISHKMVGNRRKELPVEEFEPWYCPHNQQFHDSFRNQVWTALVTLKYEVFKAMSTGGKWDGTTKSAKIAGMSASIWGFICSEIKDICDEQDIIMCSFKGGRARKQMFPNLSVTNRKLNTTLT